MARKPGMPETIKVTPVEGGTKFRFLLQFPEHTRRAPIEFEIGAGTAMTLLKALQHLQARHKIPIPPSLRTKVGKPKLSIVDP